MADTVRAQLYLSLDIDEAARLDALLDETAPACVRLRVADGTAAETARACREICHARDIPLLIAGEAETAISVAREAQADGVHLSGAPKATPWARRELGEDCIVGIDPGPSRHDAMIAAETGADYVSLSPDWPEDGAIPDEIAWWAAMIETPMVVENGASAARLRLLADVAEFVAVGSDDAKALAPILSDTTS